MAIDDSLVARQKQFPSAIGSSRARFVALWVAWAVLLFGGILVGAQQPTAIYRSPVWCRMASSVVLVIAGWCFMVALRQPAARRYAALIASGMTLGAVGDFFNADLLNRLIPLPDPVLGAIVAFGIGHVLYITACVELGNRTGLNRPLPRYGSIVAWLLIAGVGWYFAALAGEAPREQAVVWLALPYSLLLAGTAGIAGSLALQDRRFTFLFAGAALFLVSDLILAVRLFHGEFNLAGDIVWLTYGPGQMLIVFAAPSAAAALSELPDVSTNTDGTPSA